MATLLPPPSIFTILIIRVSSMGDVVHTLPALFLLKRLYPQAKIGWIVQKKVAELLIDQPFCDFIWVLDDHYLHPRSWIKTLQTVRAIRSNSWDVILDFQGIVKTSCLLFFLKGIKIGFSARHARLGITSWFTSHHVKPIYTNIIQKNLALASCMHLRDLAYKKNALNPSYHTSSPLLSTLIPGFFMHIPHANQTKVLLWLEEHRIKKFIVFSPNTTWPSKLWPLLYWQELLNRCKNIFPNYDIIILGKSFGNPAKMLCSYAVTQNHLVFSPPPWDLITITHLISQSSLIIAPDTGFLHLADFMGVKTLGIFGPTSAKRHGPFLNEENRKNCIQITCPHIYKKMHSPGLNCMETFTSDHMMKKIAALLTPLVTLEIKPVSIKQNIYSAKSNTVI